MLIQRALAAKLLKERVKKSQNLRLCLKFQDPPRHILIFLMFFFTLNAVIQCKMHFNI